MSISAGEAIWHTGTEISVIIQTATGPPVIAEGYQECIRSLLQNQRVWFSSTESYPIRFLTARQERTEVVTRAGLVFSMRRGLFLYPKRRSNVLRSNP